MNDQRLKKADIQHIADEGTKIYEQIKSRYDPKENGKFLAIEIESKDVFLARTSARAVELARKQYPDKIFYIVKIGFDVAETVAHAFLHHK